MTELSTGTRVKMSEDVLFQELQGDAVLLDLKTGVYFGLDQVGTRIWHLMEDHALLSDVVAGLMREYDVPEQRCIEDVIALVSRLQEQGLLAIE
jgi:hypothetical protein